ncbi:AAA family ATPase [Plantactinospora sp. WMMB782]|uniref:AAA family ATPase n=1 Tax=Plantactinospora sp. WMMB782 TaxID=3404121 RepID=UPI003B93BB76
MPQLVIVTGPIAAGKNTVAERLARQLTDIGSTVVIADVDEVAAMVGPPGAGPAGLWFAAHEAHGAMVGQWMRSEVDCVVAVGPFHTEQERTALTRTLPADAPVLWVVVDAPVSVTLARAQADPTRALSRDPTFHHSRHRHYRELLPTIPADRTFDSAELTAEQIAAEIARELAGQPSAPSKSRRYSP